MARRGRRASHAGLLHRSQCLDSKRAARAALKLRLLLFPTLFVLGDCEHLEPKSRRAVLVRHLRAVIVRAKPRLEQPIALQSSARTDNGRYRAIQILCNLPAPNRNELASELIHIAREFDDIREDLNLGLVDTEPIYSRMNSFCHRSSPRLATSRNAPAIGFVLNRNANADWHGSPQPFYKN